MQSDAPYISPGDMEAVTEAIQNADFASFSAAYGRSAANLRARPADADTQAATVSCIALLCIIAFAAIGGGMPHEYGMDLFTHYAALLMPLHSISDMDALVQAAAGDFCGKLKEYQREKNYRSSTIEAIRYIHRHIYEKFTVQDISEAVHLNRGTLAAYFKLDTGLTITAYIRAFRLKEAKYLLDDKTIPYAQIVKTLGFCNQSYFIKRFREYYGVSPKQYREQH